MRQLITSGMLLVVIDMQIILLISVIKVREHILKKSKNDRLIMSVKILYPIIGCIVCFGFYKLITFFISHNIFDRVYDKFYLK